MVIARNHTFAGSWYPDNAEELSRELKDHLENSNTTEHQGKKVKALISPHAGYRYSAPTAAHGYNCVKNSSNFHQITTVFVLGPCHRVYLDDQCALSRCDQCNTPLGALKINKSIQNDLTKKCPGLFVLLKDKKNEEEEHSLELQFPFISYLFKERLSQIQIVPIMVGDLSRDSISSVGSALSPYFDDDSSLLVISSDFCHWGKRFSYQYIINEEVHISKSIAELDMLGVHMITNKSNNPDEFHSYIKKYKNTICGKYPILIMLHTLNHSDKWKNNHQSVFLKYDQSSRAKSMEDSSVSYVSIVVTQ